MKKILFVQFTLLLCFFLSACDSDDTVSYTHLDVYKRQDKQNPVNIAKAAIEHAKNQNFNVVILDTAGRLHVDEDMMQELIRIKEEVNVDQTILVVDAMTGQDAVNVAESFNQKVGIDGVILTKMDGDTRGLSLIHI